MILRWLHVLLLSLALVAGPGGGSAQAQQPTPFDSLETWSEGFDALGDGGAMLANKEFNQGLVTSWFNHRDQINRMDRLLASASEAAPRSASIGAWLEKAATVVSLGLTAAKAIWHVAQGDYQDALEEAMAGLGGFAASWAVGSLATLAAGAVCLSLGPASLALCYAAFTVGGAYVAGWAGNAGQWAGRAATRRLYCWARNGDGNCDAVPFITDEDEPPRQAAIEPGPPPGPSTARSNASASKGQSGSAVPTIAPKTDVNINGSTNITVRANDITTQATGGGRATTAIGAVNRAQSTTVITKDVTTTATGRSAETTIGGPGVVSTGDVINRGGKLDIGATGVSRNGMKCVDVYLNTCIVYQYRRRPHDGCMPGFWLSGLWCKKPSDTDHSLPSGLPIR